MERESMVFYKSFLDTILKIGNAEVGYELFVAITSYSLKGEDPKLSGMSDAFWTLIKPQLDANLRKYENGKKGARHGIKGGRPKKPLTNPKETPNLTPKKPLTNPKLTPNVNVNVNENENVNENDKAMGDFSFLNPTELLLQSKPLPFSPAINEKLTAFLSMNRIANINSVQTYEKLIADQIKTHGETHVLNIITQGTLANWKSLQVKYFKKENDNDVPMGYLPEFKTGYEKKLYLRKRLMAYGQYAKKIEGFNHEYNCRYSRTLTKDNTNEYIKIINELDELFPILKEHK